MFVLGLTNYLTILLVLIATVGDYIVVHSSAELYKALFDNATHALVGGICWLIVAINHKQTQSAYAIYEVFLCTMIASLIDLDHFVAAKSLNLKDATQLKQRPPLHSSTIPFLVSLILFLVGYCWLRSWLLVRISCIIWVAFATHHTRDAYRRGFWFSPFGSTPPIPYYLYIAFTLFVPYLIVYALNSIDVAKVRTVYLHPSSILQHF